VRAGLGALDPRGDHPRLGHGLHRRHGRQRGAAGDPGPPRRYGRGRAVDRGVLRALAGGPDPGRRLSGRPLRPQAYLRCWYSALRRIIGVVRPRGQPGAAHRRAGRTGGGRRAARAGVARDHQRLLRGGKERPGHRHMVGVLRDNGGHRSGSWRVPGRERLVAGGLPHKRAERASSSSPYRGPGARTGRRSSRP
jgi:hypothetical protein